MKVEMLKKTKEHHSMRPTRQIALSFFYGYFNWVDFINFTD